MVRSDGVKISVDGIGAEETAIAGTRAADGSDEGRGLRGGAGGMVVCSEALDTVVAAGGAESSAR